MSRKCIPWKWSERQFVKDNYASMGPVVIAAKLGRSVDSVKHVARRVRAVGQERPVTRWTAEEKRRFMEVYRKSPRLAQERFGVTAMTANAYASRWGCNVRKAWSSDEDAVLTRLWPLHQDEEIIRITGRSLGAIRNRAFKIGLRRPAIHEWTKWRFSEAV